MRVAVVGGTGVVGRHVVRALRASGHDALALARSTGVDVERGTGLDRALQGAGAVVDVSTVVTWDRRRSVRFFESSTRHLLAAGGRAGVRHLVVLSIVGVDRVDLGYYAGKRRQEELALAGPLPATVLRATQFHEFPGQVLARVPGPVGLVPRMRTQPIAAREVGEMLARTAVGEPSGRVPDVAGPQVHDLVDLAREVVRHAGRRRPVVGFRYPGRAGGQLSGGGLLPAGDGPRGTITFGEWLTEQGAQ